MVIIDCVNVNLLLKYEVRFRMDMIVPSVDNGGSMIAQRTNPINQIHYSQKRCFMCSWPSPTMAVMVFQVIFMLTPIN